MHRQMIEQFLSAPLSNADEIFRMFAALPGAVTAQGKKPLQRYVYVPGTRADRILLVAHGDTVWDRSYGKAAETTVVFRDGAFFGTNPLCGIGADDRAGCAMLWALRDSGHSLLLVDGEEHGKHGAQFLRKHSPALYRQINRHRFMIELDWQGSGTCLYNQVDNTPQFKAYIAERLGFSEAEKGGGCDLQVLCNAVCGVNVGVGYHLYHRAGENLVLSEWENTLERLSAFLNEEHPRFPIPAGKRIARRLRRCKGMAGKLLRGLGLRK